MFHIGNIIYGPSQFLSKFFIDKRAQNNYNSQLIFMREISYKLEKKK